MSIGTKFIDEDYSPIHILALSRAKKGGKRIFWAKTLPRRLAGFPFQKNFDVRKISEHGKQHAS